MLRITTRPTKNKDQPPTMQHSVALAIAAATATVTASTRVAVVGKGAVGGGLGGKTGSEQPCLDSNLVQQSYNHSTFTTFITATTATAASVTSAACTKPTVTRTSTTKTLKNVHTENQLENSLLADAPAPVIEAGGGRPGSNPKLVQHPLRHPTFADATTAITPTATASTSIQTSTTTTATTATEEVNTVLGENQLEKILPDVLPNVALFLPSCQDFTNLLLTCKCVYYGLNSHWLRHQRFLLRFGQPLLITLLNPRDPNTLELLSGGTEEVEDAHVATTEELAKWYSKHSRKAVPAEEMGLSHRDNGYWRFVNDSRSPYGKVARLNSGLSWLDVSANMHGVMPGRYWVQWGFLLNNPSSVVGTQFRVTTFPRDEIPIWHNEVPNVISYTPQSFRRFLHHTNVTNKDSVSPNQAIIFQLPEILVVDEEKPTVFLQMREHDQHKDGITVLFLRLVPAEDEEEDVKAEREDVEGELDAVVEIGEQEWDEDEYGGDYNAEENGFEWGLNHAENEDFADYDAENGEEEGGVDFANGELAFAYPFADVDGGGGENGDEHGDGDNEIGGNAYGGVGAFSIAVPFVLPNGDEEADNDARPYFLRTAHH